MPESRYRGVNLLAPWALACAGAEGMAVVTGHAVRCTAVGLRPRAHGDALSDGGSGCHRRQTA